VIDKAAEARRHVDCFLLTNDLSFKASGRQKPDFSAMRYLRSWATTRKPLQSLLQSEEVTKAPEAWVRPKVAGRDFLMPWNIAKEFWPLYDKPAEERPLYPFNAEPLDQFIAKYKNTRDVPLFQSKLVVPVIYLNNVPELFKDGSAFLRYLRETKAPFAILINYASAQLNEAEGKALWQLLNGEFKDSAFCCFPGGSFVRTAGVDHHVHVHIPIAYVTKTNDRHPAFALQFFHCSKVVRDARARHDDIFVDFVRTESADRRGHVAADGPQAGAVPSFDEVYRAGTEQRSNAIDRGAHRIRIAVHFDQ
jgi:hypothetical protein